MELSSASPGFLNEPDEDPMAAEVSEFFDKEWEHKLMGDPLLRAKYGNGDAILTDPGTSLMIGGFAVSGITRLAGVVRGLTASGVSTAAAKGGFGTMMEGEEAARYAKYWESYAPKQVTPGTTRMDWVRVSGRTGRMESSQVIYDSYGRQIYRVDFSNHMRALDHSVPHLHQYQYGPGFDPIKGSETLFNFW